MIGIDPLVRPPAVVDALLAAVRENGPASRFIIRGEPGAGKSWIVDRFRDALPDSALLLSCSGHPAETDLAFAGLHELVSGLALEGLLPAQRQALSRALGGEPGEPEDGLAIAAGLLALVTEAARTRPVVILVDDAHWLDDSTLSCLVFVARRLDRDAVTMVVATRASATVDDADGFSRSRFESLEIERLSEAESRALLRQRYPELSSLVVGRVLQRADGLPLALVQLPADLSSEERSGLRPLDPAVLGASVGALYTSRLRLLGRRGRLALLIVALDDVTLEQFAHALRYADLAPADLDRALASGLAQSTGSGIRCVHPTVLPAVEAMVSQTDRALARRAVISALRGEPSRQAVHLDAVTVGTDDAVADALQAAAEDAWQRAAYPESARWWLASSARTTSPARAHSRLGESVAPLVRCGAGAELITTLDGLIAEATTDLERAHWFTQRLVAAMFTGASRASAEAVVDTATAIAEVAPEEAGHLLTCYAYAEAAAGRLAVATSTVDLARELVAGDAMSLPDRLVHDTIDLLAGVEGAGSLVYSDWSAQLTESELCDPATPLPLILNHLLWTGGSTTVGRVLERQRETLDRRGILSLRGICEGMSILLPVLRGEWNEADARFETVERILLDTDFVGPLPYIQLQHAGLLAARGDVEGTHRLIDAALGSTDRTEPIHDYARACILGRLALTLGANAEACELLISAGRMQDEMGMVEPGFFDSSGDLFAALVRVRRSSEALGRLEELERWASATGRHATLAVVLRCRGAEAADDDVDRVFESALREHADDPNEFEIARTELNYGQRLRRLRRKSDARAPLHRALELFATLGAAPWVELTRAELAACGERRSDAGPSGILDPLTPQERAVAVSVAEGLSNADVAARMFLSVRTVEYHLASVYRKLGLRGRAALAEHLVAHRV